MDSESPLGTSMPRLWFKTSTCRLINQSSNHSYSNEPSYNIIHYFWSVLWDNRTHPLLGHYLLIYSNVLVDTIMRNAQIQIALHTSMGPKQCVKLHSIVTCFNSDIFPEKWQRIDPNIHTFCNSPSFLLVLLRLILCTKYSSHVSCSTLLSRLAVTIAVIVIINSAWTSVCWESTPKRG